MKNYIRKNLKETKGITLVALVITIIVLLILAGVSLGMVFNEKGIFTRAEATATEHRGGTVQDEVTVWKNNKKIAKYDGTTQEELNQEELKGLDTRSEKAKNLVQKLEELGYITNEDIETLKGLRANAIAIVLSQYERDLLTLEEAITVLQTGSVTIGTKTIDYRNRIYPHIIMSEELKEIIPLDSWVYELCLR